MVDGPEVICGDAFEVLQEFPDNYFDSIVTDPPYGIAFMGKKWDYSLPAPKIWRECLRVLKPGGYLVAFSSPRTFHRMTCRIEDVGFDIRDGLYWMYGCLSTDTEILVNGEFVPWHRAMVDDLALCYDVAHDRYEWLPIQERFLYEYDDTAYRITCAGTDQIVSRNHRCIVSRGRGWEFATAEEIAREHSVHVPVLEAVPTVRAGLRGDEYDSATPKQALQRVSSRVSARASWSEGTAGRVQAHNHHVLSMRHASNSTECVGSRCCEPDVRASMQRENARAALGCEQVRHDGDQAAGRRVEARKESGVEGRHNAAHGRQLRQTEVGAVPVGIRGDGAGGRVCRRTSVDRCACDRACPCSGGSCAPRGQQHREQFASEPCAVPEQQRPQILPCAGPTVAVLARVEPFHLKGHVWCVRVPTGAFVARRNGKIFVTGNSGWPKGLNIAKAIDAMHGHVGEVVGRGIGASGVQGIGASGVHGGAYDITRATHPAAIPWEGWNTALKPSIEPATLAQKPISESTIAKNVLRWGTGGLNIDACRVPAGAANLGRNSTRSAGQSGDTRTGTAAGMLAPGTKFSTSTHPRGRYPANLLHDGSPEVLSVFPESKGQHSNVPEGIPASTRNVYGRREHCATSEKRGDTGSAARFFYTAKATRADRDAGLDGSQIVTIFSETQRSDGSWGNAAQLVQLRVVTEQSAIKVIDASGSRDACAWSMSLFGKPLTALSRTDTTCTIATGTSSTTLFQILSYFQNWLTNEGIQGAFSVTENGGNRAENAGARTLFAIITSEKMVSALGVNSALSRTRLRVNVSDARNIHSTVKPTDLMRYLCTLVTPRGGVVLDPFCGSGSTGRGAVLGGFRFVGADLDAHYCRIARARIAAAMQEADKK